MARRVAWLHKLILELSRQPGETVVAGGSITKDYGVCTSAPGPLCHFGSFERDAVR